MDPKVRCLVDRHQDNEVRGSPFTPNDFKRMCTVLLTAPNLLKGSLTFVAPFAGHLSCALRLFVPGVWVGTELGRFGGVH